MYSLYMIKLQDLVLVKGIDPDVIKTSVMLYAAANMLSYAKTERLYDDVCYALSKIGA